MAFKKLAKGNKKLKHSEHQPCIMYEEYTKKKANIHHHL
jgi:hypothetical protein